MDSIQEKTMLERYAQAAQCQVLNTQADLDGEDRVLTPMLNWCLGHQHIVVIQDGRILTARPTSRDVQACKVVMHNQGIKPAAVVPCNSELIRVLLAAAETERRHATHPANQVTNQQQRLRNLVKEAISLDATDIHFEVREDVTRIRFRKHGELYFHAEWLPQLGREVVAVAFNKETDQAATHFNPFIPQSAAMPLDIDGEEVRLRLASLPAHGGFDVVMRILTTHNERAPSLSQLGYGGQQLRLIQKSVNMPHGAVIVSGPTGSGKTTTLASCMQLISRGRKVYTIEDPVEKRIETATQVPVNTEHYDRSFANMTRTTLRMDPDVIVIGEMRDNDTATIMTRAAITGHLVFSTLHTNSAPDIITRLSDLGVSNNLLSSPNFLVCLISQRLAPLLCNDCKIPIGQSMAHRPFLNEWRDLFGPDFNHLYARGTQCAVCNGLGVSGRTVVAEVIWPDEKGRHFIRKGDILGWQQYLRANGWQRYGDQLLELVRAGRCDPADAEKLIGSLQGVTDDVTFDYRQSA